LFIDVLHLILFCLFFSILTLLLVGNSWQRRRNEFESAGGGWHMFAPEFFVVPPQLFASTSIQLVVLVSAFVMVSKVWSVSCLLFFYSRCLRAQPFVKVGALEPVPHGVGATDSWCIRHIYW